jgi:hypothetical protein
MPGDAHMPITSDHLLHHHYHDHHDHRRADAFQNVKDWQEKGKKNFK